LNNKKISKSVNNSKAYNTQEIQSNSENMNKSIDERFPKIEEFIEKQL
jgi:hypothetical protein